MHELSLPKRWLARPPRATVPAHLRPWLTDPASLTARITARCLRFRVMVLRQALDHPHPDEADLFGLRPRNLVWVREVLLLADERPVVFARSILPRGHASGTWHLFHRIGTRPLGAALFANPAIVRSPLSSACLAEFSLPRPARCALSSRPRRGPTPARAREAVGTPLGFSPGAPSLAGFGVLPAGHFRTRRMSTRTSRSIADRLPHYLRLMRLDKPIGICGLRCGRCGSPPRAGRRSTFC